jgi:hypothetical protein
MCAARAAQGRDIVAYFAGHLAHVFNGDGALPAAESVVEIHPFSLYDRIRNSLTTNRKYAEELVGAWAYAPTHSIEDAADFYFDSVIDRPIQPRRGEPSSADNLARLVGARAVGPFSATPAGKTLSIWKALTGGPTRLSRFQPGGEIFELSHRILKCLDAANRPYGEVLRLGLCPRDWLVGDDAVGVNALKAANAFLKALKTEMRGDLGRRPTASELDAAFAKAPPSNAATVQAFVASPLGAAIVTRLAGQDQTYIISFDWVEGEQAAEVLEDEEAPLMDATEAAPYIQRAVAAGAIEPAERDLLVQILAGRSLTEALGDSLALRRRIKSEFGGDIGAYVERLSARTAKFVRATEARP